MSISEKLLKITENSQLLYEAGKAVFGDKIQNSGSRTDYSYAFAKWSGAEIKPLYGIKTDRLMYTFTDCVNLVDLSVANITLTGEYPNMMYTFANCLLLAKPPSISADETVKAVRVMTSCFANCTKLKEAVVCFGSGEIDPVEIRSNMQNAFYKCEAMENVTFSGKGSPLSLDLSPCTKLEKQSLVSLKNALLNVSAAQAGNYDIKLAEETLSLLSDAEIKEFNDLGWNLIV